MRIEHEPQKDVPSRRKTVFLFIGLVAVILLFAGAYVSARKLTRSNDPANYDPVSLAPKTPESLIKKVGYFVLGANEPLEKKDDRVNILLLGMGGPGHEGPYLTDTIIIASIRQSDSQVALISIPRDLAIRIPGWGIQKINHANSAGEEKKTGWGGAFATELIAKEFNLEIPYYIRVDFEAFKEIIDALGGVTVAVDRSFSDSNYPVGAGGVEFLSFDAGTQTMDGSTALKFARSRQGTNGEGSDFARARRQQKILLAIKDKALSYSTLLSPVRMKKMLDALDRHLTTNMEFSEMLSLIRIARDMDGFQAKTLVLDAAPDGYLEPIISEDGAYLLVPKSGNFDSIRSAVAGIFDDTQSAQDTAIATSVPAPEGPIIEIQNGTWRPGLAATLKVRLREKQFSVEHIGNTKIESKPTALSGIYSISDLNTLDTQKKLQDELKFPIKQSPPEGITQPATTTDILIIIGDDFSDIY